MAMNFGQIALAVAGGAAEQFVKTQKELREEYKEKKERQQQWADRYGRQVLDELQSRADVVLNAGETLENAGMTSANLTQMVNEYDANSILELAKRVEKLNPRELAALKTNGQLNEVLTFEDTNAKSAEDWADVAVKSFTIPQIEPEPTPTELARTGGQRAGLLAGLRDRMGPRQEREYEEWYNSTYITGPDGEEYSIRELRAAPTGIMDRGEVPDFNLSMFDGGISSQETREWGIAEDKIVEMGLEAAKEDQSIYTKLTTNDDGKALTSSAILLKLKTEPELREYYEEAVRNTYNQSEAYKSYFDNNRAAFNFFGNEEKMNNILNTMTLDEEFAATGIKESELKVFDTDKDAEVFWERDPANWAIIGGEVSKRPDGITVNAEDAAPVEDKLLVKAKEDQAERLKTADNIVPLERPELSGRSGTREYNESLRKRGEFDAANEGKYELDGTAILAPMYPNSEAEAKLLIEPPWNFNVKGKAKKDDAQGPLEGDSIRTPSQMIADLKDKTLENFQEEWNTRYKKTHDPLTGFPLGAKFTDSKEVPE